MKKAMRSLLSVLLIAALVCTVLPVALATDPASNFAITHSSDSVYAGDSLTLTASGKPTVEGATLKEGTETYTWTGSTGLTVTGTGATATATAATPGVYTAACTYTATYLVPAKEEGGGDEVNMREEKRTVEKEGERTVGEEECRGIEKTDIGREDGEKCASERAEGK